MSADRPTKHMHDSWRRRWTKRLRCGHEVTFDRCTVDQCVAAWLRCAATQEWMLIWWDDDGQALEGMFGPHLPLFEAISKGFDVIYGKPAFEERSLIEAPRTRPS